jgi:hypothetical protein
MRYEKPTITDFGSISDHTFTGGFDWWWFWWKKRRHHHHHDEHGSPA